jgi:uncharacterized protein involved in exopolysaccharide biosynthesis
LFRAVYEFRLCVIVVLLLSVMVGVALILVSIPVYESRAVLLIKFGRDQVYRPEVGPESPPIVPAMND